MGEVIITKEIAFVGMKVKRGRDWVYSNQDVINGSAGTIVELETASAGWVKVKWDNGGGGYCYRIGADGGMFDLYLWKPEGVQTNPTSNPMQENYLTTTLGLNKGDKLKFARHLADSKFCADRCGMSIGSIVEMDRITAFGLLTLKNGNEWNFDIGCFTKPSELEIARAGMPVKTTTQTPTQPPQIVKLSSSGYAMWGDRLPKVGQLISCIKEDNYSRIYAGEVLEVTNASASYVAVVGKGASYPTSHFVPAGEYYEDINGVGRYASVYSTPPPQEKKTEIISKPIKTSQNVNTSKSTVSVSRGECGNAFKVSRPLAKIKRGKGSGQVAIRCGRPEAQLGRSHS